MIFPNDILDPIDPANISAKASHVSYEQARVFDLSKEDDMTKFAELNRQMQENSKKIPMP